MSEYAHESFEGTSVESLRQYTDILLGAAELADILDSHEPKITESLHRVSDPRTIDNIDLPPEISGGPVTDTELRAVSFSSTITNSRDEILTRASVEIDFADSSRAIIEMIDGQHRISFCDFDTPSSPIDSRITSNILARLTHPSNDPELSDYTNILDHNIIKEINDTLETDQLATSIVDRAHDIGQSCQIILEKINGKLLNCEIIDLRYSDIVGLEVGFEDFANASNIYVRKHDSPEGVMEDVPLDIDTYYRFGKLIDAVQKQLRPDITTVNDDL